MRRPATLHMLVHRFPTPLVTRFHTPPTHTHPRVTRRILYKLRGAAAVANLPLGDDDRASLDGTTLDALMRSVKSDNRAAQQAAAAAAQQAQQEAVGAAQGLA